MSGRRALIISGSRNPDGQTAQAIRGFAEGFKAAGGEVEAVFLPELDIQRCRQCNNDGWGECTASGVCCIEDDLHSVAARMREADGVVFATPVYWSDLSESLKAFLDRLRRICRHDDGAAGIRDKKAVGVCVAGGGGGGSYQCTRELEWVLSTAGMDVVDIVAARRQNLPMKVETLKITGRWFHEQIGG